MNDSDHKVRLRTLGPIGLTRPDGSDITAVLSQPKRLALLTYLAVVNGGALCRRDTVLGVFWPEFDQDRARAALRKALHFLRRELGEGVVVTRGDEEIGVDPDRLRSDVSDFLAAAASEQREQALALYRGEFLTGFHLAQCAEFEHWADGVRAEQHALAVQLAREQTEAEAEANPVGAVRWACEWTRLAPADETAARQLIALLHATGDRSGALEAYRSLRSALQTLGLEPSPGIRAVAERVREPSPDHAVTTPRSPLGPQSRDALERAGATGGRSRRTVVLGALVLLVGGTAGSIGWWRWYQAERWARWEAFTDIETRVEAGDFETAHRLARRATAIRPQDSALSALWRSFTRLRSVTSDPPGARVYRRDYYDTLGTGELLGVTPLDTVRVPRGASRLRFEKAEYETAEHLAWWNTTARNIYVRLDTLGGLPNGMVRVLGGPARFRTQTLRVADFLLDRYEVTNEAYQRFVDAGGYSRLEFWEHPFVDGGDTLTWMDAIARFVDRTGRPGPATWDAGTFPDGRERYPVSGVSWHEAAAYARFAGKELVTGYHWYRAYERQLFPWIFATSNLAGDGSVPVGASAAMSTYGSYDMAGNVREWLANGRDDLRFIAGASWEDGQWIAQTGGLPPALDRSPTNGFRLAVYPNESDSVLALARRPVPQLPPPVDYASLAKPVPDELYDVYRRFFEYGSIPLNVAIEASDTTRRWVHQRISFDAGYPEDRVTLHLFLPLVGTPPYQTVVYFPGGASFSLDDFEQYTSITYDFIVKSGRAFAFPVYRGQFNRRLPPGVAGQMENTVFLGKDLIRTVEYLGTRPDIDTNRMAYYGFSGGVVFAPIALGLVERFKAAVLLIGGWGWTLSEWDPEFSPLTYIPRVKAPILLMSGRYDYAFDLETTVKPWLPYFGTPPEHIRHVIEDGGHFIPRPQYIRETLDFLDEYLGPVGSTASPVSEQ